MNHIARDFRASSGAICREHAWEVREGGYRRLALLFGYPTWPVANEKRLVKFLLDRGFLVKSPELGFGSSSFGGAPLSSLRSTEATWADEQARNTGLPVYLLCSSFSVALFPAFKGLPSLASVALIAPVLEFPPQGTRFPRCFMMSTASLEVENASLSGKPELLSEVMESKTASLRFRKRDLRSLASWDIAVELAAFGLPAACFVGEDDPFAPAAGYEALAAKGIKVHAYPRVRHAPAFDRYADNFYADLGSFFDEVEASRKRAGTKP